MTKSLGCTCTKRSFGKASKILFFARCLRFLKICSADPLVLSKFSKLGNTLHLDTPLIVGIFIKTFLSHLRAKYMYGKSPQNFLSIFTSRQLKLSLNVLIRSIYLSIMETTRWDLSNDNVICIGILLCWHANDVMFWGFNSNFGTQKNHATTTWTFWRKCAIWNSMKLHRQ